MSVIVVWGSRLCCYAGGMMKSIKVGMAIVGIAVVSGIIIGSFVLFKKKRIDDQQVVVQKISDIQYDDIPLVEHDMQYHNQKSRSSKIQFQDQDDVTLVIVPEKEKPLPIIMPEQQDRFVIEEDYIVANHPVCEKSGNVDLQSFVTMKIADDYRLDIETQLTLDILIGNDFNQFINLILQSNNDIVSKEACRSCGLYAFFKKIKHRKQLRPDEIKTLQHMVGNLYRFVETMRKLSGNFSGMSVEQYAALQDLNRPQVLKNSMKLQARKTAAAAALRKLQSMSNR